MHQKLIQGIQIAHSQSRFEATIRMARELIQLDPECALAYRALGSSLADLNQLDEAVAAGFEAVRLDPQDGYSHFTVGRVLHLAECPQALIPLTEAVKLVPEESGFWWAISATHFDNGDGPQALQAAEQGLSIDPEEPDCLKQRAMALALVGDAKGAIQAMELAFARRPTFRFNDGAAGWMYLQLNELMLAATHLRQALTIDPHAAWVHEGLGMALVGLNQLDQGLEHLLESVRLNPWAGRRARAGLRKLNIAVPPRRTLRLPTHLWRYSTALTCIAN
ncbi:MAG: tetratricopeptide repeat protein [Pirellulaceae bacterium]|nr:tetratricopeptide repeat protein [Pirellulaceae bacterium]